MQYILLLRVFALFLSEVTKNKVRKIIEMDYALQLTIIKVLTPSS